MLSQSTYDTPITVNVYADSTGDILVETFKFDGCSIQSFNLSTGAAIASVRLPTVSESGDYCRYVDSPPMGLARFGANGIAIGTNVFFVPGYVIVITGAFVAP
jgi:hypothetical protein